MAVTPQCKAFDDLLAYLKEGNWLPDGLAVSKMTLDFQVDDVITVELQYYPEPKTHKEKNGGT